MGFAIHATNVAATRRNHLVRCLLSLGLGAPPPTLHQLDARRLHQDRDGEQGENGVRQTNSARANHAGWAECAARAGGSPHYRHAAG